MDMRVLITGSTGLIGSRLSSFLINNNHRAMRLVRRVPSGADEVGWDPSSGILDPSAMEGIDAVVHLAGESIAARWTAEKKRRIRESRILGTRLLAQSIARLSNRPRVLVSASAIGYYGDRGEEQLTETSSLGKGFLPELCGDPRQAPSLSAFLRYRGLLPAVDRLRAPAFSAEALSPGTAVAKLRKSCLHQRFALKLKLTSQERLHYSPHERGPPSVILFHRDYAERQPAKPGI